MLGVNVLKLYGPLFLPLSAHLIDITLTVAQITPKNFITLMPSVNVIKLFGTIGVTVSILP
jgi:hypothetical protein